MIVVWVQTFGGTGGQLKGGVDGAAGVGKSEGVGFERAARQAGLLPGRGTGTIRCCGGGPGDGA